MHILTLKFENAGLIYECSNKKTKKYSNFRRTGIGNEGVFGEFGGHDIHTPIPYTLLSNVLHVLCGEMPVPTKQWSFFERQQVFDDIAKQSIVHYNLKPVDDEGRVQFDEFWALAKCAFNSNYKITTTFHTRKGDMTYKGHYTNSYLRQTFSSKENYQTFCNFLSDLVGKDFHSFNLSDYIMEVSKLWGSKEFETKFDNFLAHNKPISQDLKVWASVFRGIEDTTRRNTEYNSKTPLLNAHSVGKIIFLSGEIKCPIKDEGIIDRISRNGGTARLLEGGIIYVYDVETVNNVDSLQDKYMHLGWEKIYNEEETQATEDEVVIN